MRFRSAALLASMVVFGLAGAQATEAPSKLPIDVPRDATVNFEADAPGSDLLPVIKQLLGAGLLDGNAGRPETITVKTGLGDLEFKPKDIAELLRPVREMHVVSYALPKDAEDPLKHHEGRFAAEGMRRVVCENGFLMMRRSGDRYAVVLRQKDNVTVMRIDGMPNLGVATNVVLRGIATAAQRAATGKRAGH